jgi:Flp pilus assembly secretin CpaC
VPTAQVQPRGFGAILTLQLGVAVLHQQETAFTNAVVGDTKIIEIVPITDHSLTIVPVATGLTNILLLDDVGNQVGNVGIAVVADEPAAPTDRNGHPQWS